MIANYHTHTTRCRHASGTEEEYVQRAIEGELKILGFSDHTPYPFPEGYYTHMRMFPEQLDEYVDTVLRLREQYRDCIDIRLGLEVEYYPAYFSQLLQILRDRPIEYMLLGQHWMGSEIGEPYNGRPTEDEKHLERYCDQVIEAMQTGLFTYLAHPDLIHFTGSSQSYCRHVRRLCREAKQCGVPLEINLLGMRTGRHYPNALFWQTAGEEGCKAVIGCDAHTPETAWDPETEAKAFQLAERCGVELLQTLPLISIG